MTNLSIETLGVLCELESSPPHSPNFSVLEFADFSDGARKTLHNDRGWTVGVLRRLGSAPVDYFGFVAERDLVEAVIDSAYSTLLPEDDSDDHDWLRLKWILKDMGIEVSAQDLRELPYIVEFGPNLLAKLPPTQAATLPKQISWADYHDY